ncbi:iron-sulfur cluster assembly protein [Leptothrix sp. BB-4]
MDTRGGTTIWIQAVRAPNAELRLAGPQDQLDAVLAALREVRELREPLDIVSSGRVQAIEIADGEATLTLRMGQGLCDDAHALAEQAFDALRGALPDTDLYLCHDRPMGCAGRASSGG